jgi:predicted GH43/DUF377 family glycosyl hydrolase
LTPEVPVTRSRVRLLPDPTRRMAKPYLPVDPTAARSGMTRVERLIGRLMDLSSQECQQTLRAVYDRHADQYDDFDDVLMTGFSSVAHWVPDPAAMNTDTRRVIGAYFLHEHSLEGAALTNPSIVPSPDQTGVPDGSLNVIISLRAVSEGHISSIEFRSGVVDPTGDVDVASPAPPMSGVRQTPLFNKRVFERKLEGLGADRELVGHALGGLGDTFTMENLEVALAALDDRMSTPSVQQIVHVVHWLASSNYKVAFPSSSDISQRVLTPTGAAESRGMEDARFVRFTESDGSVTYYGTYTAFDGSNILPQLIETADFETFRIATLNGQAAVNKGMALFPRRVGGNLAALGRSDGESNYLMVSDDVRFWHEADQIQVPARPWELIQIGNAGAPLETEAGWLVITHGVGPMRRYVLGAILLDIDEPAHVIGHLREPLLAPDEEEAYGYVPNVVYSCGALVHQGQLVIAYGASDTFATFASVSLDTLLAALTDD